MELVLVSHRGAAPLQVANIAAFIGNYQRPLELPRPFAVDAEVGGQLHRAAHALGDVAEGAVGEDGRVQGRVEVVGVGHNGADVLPHEVRVVLDCLRHGAKNDAVLGELLLERSGDGHAVENGVHGHTGQSLLLFQGDAQLLVGLENLRVHLVQALQLLHRLGGRVVDDVLEVHRRVVNVGPARPLLLVQQGEEVVVRLETPLQHPLRFVLLCGNESDYVFVQTLGGYLRLNVRNEAVLVLLLCHILDNLVCSGHRPSLLALRGIAPETTNMAAARCLRSLLIIAQRLLTKQVNN